MYKWIFCFLFIVSLGTTISCGSDGSKSTIEENLVSQIDAFTSLSDQLLAEARKQTPDTTQLHVLFLNTRLAYKKFEWAAEYFQPLTAGLMNGPPAPEVEEGGNIVEPAGMQLIEGYLFPSYDSSAQSDLIRQLILLKPDAEKLSGYFKNIKLPDWQVFDATKLEVFRILTLGITGFDNPLTLHSMKESDASLESLQAVMAYYTGNNDAENLLPKFRSARGYLQQHNDFKSFDRAVFIRQHGNPLTIAVSDLVIRLNIHMLKYNRLLNQDAKTLFDSAAFNVNAYAPDHSSFISATKIALGKKLFSDPILSGNGVRSCQSCHHPDNYFMDGRAKNTNIDNGQLLDRNTPTLINAALQPALFYDLRVRTLEDQSLNVVQSSREMHGSMILSVKKLEKDSAYMRMFVEAFPYEDKTHVDTFEIMNSLGSYIRSLTLLNSRFDDYMRGNDQAMNRSEINGFNLFMGQAKCATCHYMPLFNGAFPPVYTTMESEVIGVPQSVGVDTIDPDSGRYNIIRYPAFVHAFKTSTVRNAALTAPYMHNGVFTTLDELMDFYNKGGGKGFGIPIENQTLPSDHLDLSKEQVQDIIAFIHALNSKIPLNP